MDKKLIEMIKSSVFYCRKLLDNDREFECCVVMMPLPEYNCCTYNFTLALTSCGKFDCETLIDVTTDIGKAERIFDTLCRGNVYPCHLFDVVSDLIA
ncbi:MAG: hypothetical protein IJF48_02390 [Clostridia bacterium]|nr:hypothetical protein [Clostridia bacterium]